MKELRIFVFCISAILITLIELPNLNQTAKPGKYKAVFFTVLAVSLLLGILQGLQVIPDINRMIFKAFSS